MNEKLKHLMKEVSTFIERKYQYILSILMIILLVFIIYGRDIEILANEALQSEALSHLLLAPFFAGFLFYLKKDMVKAALVIEKNRKKTTTQFLNELIGISLCLIAFLTYWYGSYTLYPVEFHLLSLPIFVMGITSILFNLKALIVLIFPILFLLFLVPPPTELMYTVGGSMANFNTQASYTLLKTFGLPVNMTSTYGPPTIEITTSAGAPTSFGIDLPCSGLYTLMAFTMFAVFLAFITSASISRKLSVFLIGFLVFEILNIVRITSIISVGYYFGEEVAMMIFHTVAGLLLIFIGMLITLIISEKFLKIQVISKSQELPSCPKCGKSLENVCSNCGKFINKFSNSFSQKFWAKLLILILGCSAVAISINAPTFAVAQGPIGVTSSSNWENATNVFPQIQDYNLRFLYRDKYYEKIAQQDASLVYAYSATNMSKTTVYVDVGVASAISNLHSWEVCLITWQVALGQRPLVSVLDSRDIQLLQNVPLIARYLSFVHPQNYTQVTLYWYEKVTFKTGITVEQKYVRISLIIITRNSTEYQRFEDDLLPIGQRIAEYWEPLKTQSLISIGVPTQQLLLTLSVAFIVFAKTAEFTNEQRKKTNNLRIFNNFASGKDMRVFEAVSELSKENKIFETKEVVDAIEKKMGKSVKSEEAFNILNHLEDYGFIKKDIVSINNKPKMIWKTSIGGIWKP